MKRLFRLLILLSIILVAGSCSKEPSGANQPSASHTKDLQVPGNFSWQTTKVIQASIGITSISASGLLSKVTLYIADPASGAEPVAAGSAGYGFNFSTTLMVPAYTEGLWLGVIYPDGVAEFAYTKLSGDNLDFSFSRNVKSSNLKEFASGPDCSTGCNQVISGNGSVTIKNGQTFCVTDSFTGTINFEHWNGGGTLRVCGTANIQNINNMGNNCNIIVADGGTFSVNSLSIDGTGSVTAWQTASFTIGSLNMNQTTTHVTNYSGNFHINSSFSPNGMVDNWGVMTITGDYNGNSSNGYLNNSGSLNIAGSMSMNNNLTNSGAITVGGNLNLNTNSTFINNCKILVTGNVALNAGTFTLNAGYLNSNNTIQLNGSGQLSLQNQSMLSTVNLTLNAGITGAGSKSSIITTGQATINGNKNVSGPIEWADNDGILTNGTTGLFINGATFVTTSTATNYVPTGTCNPEGFGTLPVTDSDGDGIADEDDDYPNDATRAFNNYYPSSTGFASMAFEDLWPSYGDFDMNDLVVNIRYNRITNAQNKVVDLINLYQVKAVGGSLRNGFAFQLDQVAAGAIESVSGSILSAGSYLTLSSNGVEAGTENPVIIVWDDAEKVIHRAGGSYFNTEINGFTGTTDPVTIQVHFSTPQNTTAIGMAPYNHFLIKGKIRGNEIHLPGNIPTSKADITLFGSGDDDTNPAIGKYYKSKSNLPWAIFIAESFDYPVEKADIITAHLKFGNWAQSGGTQYQDWYKNLPGYRNSANIYHN